MTKPIPPQAILKAVGRLSLMAFFPADENARLALMEILGELCDTEDQLQWLVGRAVQLFDKWPGIGELRALYCSRWKPKDGHEAYSTLYPSGFPSDRPKDTEHKHDAGSADPRLDKRLRDLAAKKAMPGGPRRVKP